VKISFVHRIIIVFTCLMALCLGLVLLFTSNWIVKRVDEEVEFRLNQAAIILQRLHSSASTERLGKFHSIAKEPRFRALAEVKDEQTLKVAAEEIRKEMGSAAFGFLSSDGKILAWNGYGREQVEHRIPNLINTKEDFATDVVLIPDKVLELIVTPIFVNDIVKGFTLGAEELDADILREYGVVLNILVELWSGTQRIVSTYTGTFPNTQWITRDVLLNESLHFVIYLDPISVAKPLLDMQKRLVFINLTSILIGGIVCFYIAHHFIAVDPRHHNIQDYEIWIET